MNDDLLSQAVHALREQTDAPSDASQLTRARIMASVHQKRRRRATAAFVLLPVAAVLVAGTALATATGTISDTWHRLFSDGPSESMGLTAQTPTAPAVLQQPRPVEQTEPVAASSPKPVISAQTLPPLTRPPVSPTSPRTASSTKLAFRDKHTKIDEPKQEDDGQELYRAAHHAHFQQQAYAQAVAGYDRYLAAAPGGRFALEASYNRALCLVRLGRTAEAVDALRPFARGQYGSYRQQEARRLVDALTGGDALR